jgi:2-(1,2-epoxy-1,2-dihydrophenyl)acetyl-CoA isomerase
MDDVLFERRPDGVALITLNRPDRLNAMGGELMPLFGDRLEECAQDPSVRCVAVTGAGRGFCAGGDVKGFAERAGGDGAGPGPRDFPSVLEERARGLQRSEERTALRLHTMPKPTVALVNGPAAGAGMSIALSCDIRICSDRALFVTAFDRVGFSGDYGGSWLLQRLVGYGQAIELYLTGDKIDAKRALALGIANDVVAHDDLLEEGLRFCAQLASGPTAAYGRMKANFSFAASHTLAETLAQEALNMTLSGMAHDHREGALAFAEKRAPVFTGK